MRNSKHRRDHLSPVERRAHDIRIGRMRAARHGHRFIKPTSPTINPATKLRHSA